MCRNLLCIICVIATAVNLIHEVDDSEHYVVITKAFKVKNPL